MFEVTLFAILALIVVIVLAGCYADDAPTKDTIWIWILVAVVAICLVVACLFAYDYGKSNISSAKLETGVVYETASVASVADDKYIIVLKPKKGDYVVRRFETVPPKLFTVEKDGTFLPLAPQLYKKK